MAARVSRCDPLIAACKPTDSVYKRFIANALKYQLVMTIKDENLFDNVKQKSQQFYGEIHDPANAG